MTVGSYLVGVRLADVRFEVNLLMQETNHLHGERQRETTFLEDLKEAQYICWYCLFGVVYLVLYVWCCMFGVVCLVLYVWCCMSGVVCL